MIHAFLKKKFSTSLHASERVAFWVIGRLQKTDMSLSLRLTMRVLANTTAHAAHAPLDYSEDTLRLAFHPTRMLLPSP